MLRNYMSIYASVLNRYKIPDHANISISLDMQAERSTTLKIQREVCIRTAEIQNVHTIYTTVHTQTQYT